MSLLSASMCRAIFTHFCFRPSNSLTNRRSPPHSSGAGKEFGGNPNASWGSVTISFLSALVRLAIFTPLSLLSNYFPNKSNSMLPTQLTRCQSWTMDTGEISVTALIFGYILLCGAFTEFRRNYACISRKEIPVNPNAFCDSPTVSLLLAHLMCAPIFYEAPL